MTGSRYPRCASLSAGTMDRRDRPIPPHSLIATPVTLLAVCLPFLVLFGPIPVARRTVLWPAALATGATLVTVTAG